MASLVLKNIGTIVSGNIEKPLMDGDAVYVKDGLIRQVGRFEEMAISPRLCGHGL